MILLCFFNKIINRTLVIYNSAVYKIKKYNYDFRQKETQFFDKKNEFLLFLILYVTISIENWLGKYATKPVKINVQTKKKLAFSGGNLYNLNCSKN